MDTHLQGRQLAALASSCSLGGHTLSRGVSARLEGWLLAESCTTAVCSSGTTPPPRVT